MLVGRDGRLTVVCRKLDRRLHDYAIGRHATSEHDLLGELRPCLPDVSAAEDIDGEHRRVITT
jgi:hypothetical protein